MTDRIAAHWTDQKLCSHQEKAFARFRITDGREQVAIGCKRCGRRTGEYLPHNEFPPARFPDVWLPHPDPCDCHQATAATALRALQSSPPDKNGYEAYLASPEWKQRRAYYLDRAWHRCQLCKRSGGPDDRFLNVHHSDYSRLGAELEIDVIVLCRQCHQRHHGHLGEHAA